VDKRIIDGLIRKLRQQAEPKLSFLGEGAGKEESPSGTA